MFTVCRIETSRKEAEAAYRQALTFDEAWHIGRGFIKVKHIGKPAYSHSENRWRVCWDAIEVPDYGPPPQMAFR